MKTIKTSELAGAALDWAVAQAAGVELATLDSDPGVLYQVFQGMLAGPYSPSSDWACGGPLIADFAVGFVGADADTWWAFSSPEDVTHQGTGPTHLIAACRAIVAAKFGETVDVPEELTHV